MSYRTLAGPLLALLLTTMTGCVSIEQHIWVTPEAQAEMGIALRLGPPIGGMLGGLAGNLPPGVPVEIHQDGMETVMQVRSPGPLPVPPGDVLSIDRATRLLSSSYSIELDAAKVQAMGEQFREQMGPGMRMPEPPPVEAEAGADAAKAGTIEFAQFEGMPDLGGLDLEAILEGLGGLFGGQMPNMEGMNPQAMLKGLVPSLVVHMPGRITATNGEQIDESSARWVFDIEALAGGQPIPPMTAESEWPVESVMVELAARLAEHHEVHVPPEVVSDIVSRGLLPNPEVAPEDQGLGTLDTHLYGELVTVIVALDETVGSESTPDILDSLGLLGDDASLAAATQAAKRIPALREHDTLTDLTVEDIAGILRE